MIDIRIALLTTAVVGIVCFIIAWNMSVSHWRHRNHELAAEYEVLAEKWRQMAEAMEKDPVRMGLNHGQEFILREIEAFCRKHRERLEAMS